METSTPIIELNNISKRFHAVEALTGINVSVQPGTIHALVGENGAGKSTLGKIISGVIHPDQGEIRVNGRQVQYHSPHDALRDGITIISQELSLIPQLGVAENVYLGLEPNRWMMLDSRELKKRFQNLIAQLGFHIRTDVPVGKMRVADQKKVEIIRAIARNAQLIVMDEPTASLSSDETQKLLEIIRALRNSGKTVIYVSHYLEEVLSLADTITVLRNGHLIRTAPAREETVESLVTAMLGRSVSLAFTEKTPPPQSAPTIFAIEGFNRKGVIEDIALTVREGEIVGLAGLVGSGRTETARAIFGADQRDSGQIKVRGKIVEVKCPGDAIRAGIAMLPESRKLQGLVMQQEVGRNVTLPHLQNLSKGAILQTRKEARETVDLLNFLDVRPPVPGFKITKLSGGNQQKVLFAKWLFRRPVVLIADEPTSGVDVGAKQAIYNLLKSLAEAGLGVLLISSEIEEVIGLAHRVYVMRQGRIVAQLEGAALTEDAIMHAIFAVPHSNPSGDQEQPYDQ